MITDKLSVEERVELMRAVRAWGDAQLQYGIALGQLVDAGEAKWLSDWTYEALLDLVYGPLLASEACANG